MDGVFMKTKKLFELLELVNRTTSSSSEIAAAIVTELPNCTIVKKNWENPYTFKELNLSDLNNWSTFDRHISMQFVIYDTKLVVDVAVYNSFEMERRDYIRFTARIILPDEFIHKIESNILTSVETLAERKYDDYLDNKRKTWIEKYINKLIEEK